MTRKTKKKEWTVVGYMTGEAIVNEGGLPARVCVTVESPSPDEAVEELSKKFSGARLFVCAVIEGRHHNDHFFDKFLTTKNVVDAEQAINTIKLDRLHHS